MSKIFEKNNYTKLFDEINFSPRQLNYLNLFWGGFILYIFSFVIKGHAHVSMKLGEVMQLLGLMVLTISSICLIEFKIRNNYLKPLFIAYISWLLIVIVRGIHFDYIFIMYMLLTANLGILLYFAPLVLLFNKNLYFYKKVFDVIIITGVLFIICSFSFIRELLDRSSETQDVIELLARNLAMPCGFVLLTYKYHSQKRKILALVVMVLALSFSIYKARRGLSLTLSSILILASLLYLFSTKQKILVIYLAALFTCIGLLYAANIYNISNNKLLKLIAQRGEEDTRTGVELYFYNDMKLKDWIIGRGLDGEYYCPGIDEDSPTDYRTLIETGYLQIILKGGLIRLILFLLIAIPAIFLGLFSSKNIISKASALWIVMALITLYPDTEESFNLQYLLVWISIGICYSRNIRNLNDQYLTDFFTCQRVFTKNI